MFFLIESFLSSKKLWVDNTAVNSSRDKPCDLLQQVESLRIVILS